MTEHDNLDLEIMLEIVRYVSRRPLNPTDHGATLSDILQNLPPGTSIGTIVGAITQPQEVTMGDNYKVGQGAAGPGAMAVGNTFAQVWIEHGSQIDLGNLVSELRQLRVASRDAASGEAEQDVAIGALASAEKAAADGDGPAALSHLQRAGAWVLDVAKGIGVPVAVKAMEAALGI